ncbi:hypothetical protein OAS39_06990 [Pirellulales bacterium]|nr:hypothetical protein [Pirellulales bacterium]
MERHGIGFDMVIRWNYFIAAAVALGVHEAHSLEPKSTAATADVFELAKQVEEGWLRYNYLEFQFEVSTTILPHVDAINQANPPIAVKATDTFRASWQENPQSKERQLRRTYWVRRIVGRDGQPAVQRFVAFDGTKTRTFHLARPSEPWELGSPVGNETAGNDWTFSADNIFEQFLFLRVNGTSGASHSDGGFSKLNLNRYKTVSAKKRNGSQIRVLTANGMNGNSAFDDFEYTAEVAAAPVSMVLRWEARNAKKDWHTSFEVFEIKTVDSIPYPATGRYLQVSGGQTPDELYEFKVSSVNKLADFDKENWLPEWPTGTLVRNKVPAE